MKIRQLFCKHVWRDITTTPNMKAGVAHWQCGFCHKIISCFNLARVAHELEMAHIEGMKEGHAIAKKVGELGKAPLPTRGGTKDKRYKGKV